MYVKLSEWLWRKEQADKNGHESVALMYHYAIRSFMKQNADNSKGLELITNKWLKKEKKDDIEGNFYRLIAKNFRKKYKDSFGPISKKPRNNTTVQSISRGASAVRSNGGGFSRIMY